MSITRHHNDWLRLVTNSGPFLSLPVLAHSFPQGLDAHDPDHARRLRQAFDEWDHDATLHRQWVRFVLGETLGFEELLAEGQAIPQSLKSEEAQYGETLRPDWIVADPTSKKVRLLVQAYPRSQSLTKPVVSSRWKTSPDTRMAQLLNDTGIRLGLVTNGHDWMLVNAPKNEPTGYAAWRADLWLEEPITLRAFRTLLSADRFFSVPDKDTLDLKDGLLDQSQKDQQEVTDQLGYQVRKAVEVLIQALDKADQDHGRKLLADVDEKVLYESALTVMMRLVFLFCAEERELLLLGDELYDKNYAVSTLREQLRLTADEHGEEILGLRFDAWIRLLTTFRAVYAGVKHDRLKLPAYGGSLFNPDRFPFLEGRKASTTWKTAEATPLPVSNRTVLHLLEALQVLQTKVGKTTEARSLSFRSLDIEQIGHVYEGLLDHTARRAAEPMLGLAGTRDQEPELALAELEKFAAKGEKELLTFLKDETGRSESALKKALTAELDDQLSGRFRSACQDSELWKRVKPLAGLVRLDTLGYPVVVTTGSVFVTAGTDRRSTGTHYTPKTLTEPIVQYTLEPLVFVGPAEGAPKEQWKLRSAKELLDLKICDMACGSGAFLVQTCRYMAARLLEAWNAVQEANPDTVRITPEGQLSTGKLGEMLIPDDPDERLTYALRIVAQRCVYGVDKNPLAVEMAKLSLWLLTLAKDKPFEFLDHAIRCGDSLVGITTIEQLRSYSLKPDEPNSIKFSGPLDNAVDEAINLRLKLEGLTANTVEDVQRQEELLTTTNEKMARLRYAADLLIAAEFWGENAKDKLERVRHNAVRSGYFVENGVSEEFEQVAAKERRGQLMFHWPLEFPEVIVKRGGFDAFVGNPPFMGGGKISRDVGINYADWLHKTKWPHAHGNADIVSYFFLRGGESLRNTGSFGLIATNTIAQGDTADTALRPLTATHGMTIYRAIASVGWPGAAAVLISVVYATRRSWSGPKYLNGTDVGIISPTLDLVDTVSPPRRLVSNMGLSSEGSKVYGKSFVLDEALATELKASDPEGELVILPFNTGDDFNKSPTQSALRWCIDFRTLPLSEVQTRWPNICRFVETYVRPEREKGTSGRTRDIWWQHERPRPELYSAARNMDRVLCRALVTSIWGFAFVTPKQVFANKLTILLLDSWAEYAVLQSAFHEHWSWAWGSTMKSDLNYSHSDLFQTFPFPYGVLRSEESKPRLVRVGQFHHELRSKMMIEAKEGLTPLFHHLSDPGETSTDIQKLRELHVEMDNAVAAAYGWLDLSLDHGFHETKQGVRYTISETARREILARLLRLNHERYADEVKEGLHETKKKPKTASKPKVSTTKPKATAGATLFDDDDATFPSTERDSYLCGLVCDLVKADSGLTESEYVDSLVIALGYKRHKQLLAGKDRTEFEKLCKATPLASWGTGDKIPWGELKNQLVRRKAIEQENQTIRAGAAVSEARQSYLAAAPQLVALLRKALTELRALQAHAKPDKAEILKAFVDDKSRWYVVAA